MVQLVKNLPTMWETWVPSLGWEDPLEKGKASHSSILAWRISRTVYGPWGRKESDKTEQLISLHFREPADPPRRNPSNRNKRRDQWASE